ncbi:MAG: ATP-binding protein [Candidatus Omnitrophota bacterium]
MKDESTYCTLCDNTGWVKIQKEDREVMQKCRCREMDAFLIKSEKANIPKRFMGAFLDHYYPDKKNPSQNDAKKAAQLFVNDYPAVLKGLLLQGPTGVGKTKLLCAIGSELIKKIKNVHIYYIDCNDLIREMRSGDHIQTRDYTYFNRLLHHLVTVDLLLFDELGAVTTTPWILDNIYYIFNKRYLDNKTTLCASNFLDESLNGQETLAQRIGERTRSRLYEMAQSMSIKGADLRRF